MRIKLRKCDARAELEFTPSTICNLDLGGDSPPPPDYTPVANASEEAARIAAEQADRVLAEHKRQYDANIAAAKPVIDAQLDIMRETKRQGQDYYDYLKNTYRPLEQGLVKEAVDFSTAGAREQYAREAAAALARAQANEQAQTARAMAAMGVNPNSGRFVGLTRAQSILNAGNRAAAMTSARDRAQALGFAKRLDVAGLGRGLPGASQGAYSLATGAGNAAVQNQMAPGGQYLGGLVQSANLRQAGLGQQIQGLSSILDAQSRIYAADANRSDPFGTIIGMGLGGWASGGFSGLGKLFSDRRLKENIVAVGTDPDTGLTLYEFNYVDNPGVRFRGVMADEVAEVMPAAVSSDTQGYAMVDYAKLGIPFEIVGVQNG